MGRKSSIGVLDPHLDYGGVTEEDEHWLASELKKLTGIKFIKLKSSRTDIDLESVNHSPKIYIEAEGTTIPTWPIDTIRPPKWKYGISIPARKVRYFRERVKDGEITVYIKFNHYRNQCFFTDGDTVVRKFDEGSIKEIYSPKTEHMSNTFVILEESHVYYGFHNIATFIKRKIDNCKFPIKMWRIHTPISNLNLRSDRSA